PEVVVEGLLEQGHHFYGPSRTPHRKRNVAAWPDKPACQPQIRKADHVIGVQMREKHSLHILPLHLDLVEPLHGATTCVEEIFLPSRFHQVTWSEASNDRRGRAGAQEGHFDFLPL